MKKTNGDLEAGCHTKRKTKMKKLIIAFAAGVLAVCANAATYQWSVTDINDPTSGEAATGLRGWCFVAATSKSGIKTISVDDAIALINQGADGITELKTYQLKAGKTSAGVLSPSAYDGGWGTGDTLTTYAIVFDVGDATPTGASKYIVSSTETITFANATTARTAMGLNMSNSTWTPVAPEPTSGLLLLLGMAGLALKRKRA